MSHSSNRRFEIALEGAKALLVLAGYLPYAWFSPHIFMQGWRWVIVGVGLYLSLSMAARNLTRLSKLPLWGLTLWAAFDFGLWFISQKLGYWSSPITFPGILLCADVTTIGWKYRRGLVHWAPTAVLISLGPMLDPAFGTLPLRPGGEMFVKDYLMSQGMAPFAVYAFVRMAGHLREERERVARAYAETERAHRVAELANEQLREYARQVEDVAMLRERTRISREVHDTVAHAFTGVLVQLDAVKMLIDRSPQRAQETLDRVATHVSSSLSDIRRAVHALRPTELDRQQGLPALRELTRKFEMTTQVKTELTVAGVPAELPSAHELCLYRTMQEGLTNAFRHGHARHVRVALAYTPARVNLVITDDGQAAPTAKPGVGLVGIRERAEVLNGQVTAGPQPEGGYRLELLLPLTNEEGAPVA